MHDDPLVYLNGNFTPLSRAQVSVLDRGFIFGDGVYEVVPMYEDRPFRAAQHLARLSRSLAEVRIANPYDDATWMKLIMQVAAPLITTNQLVYIQVTRGVAKRTHAFPATPVAPTVFIMSNPWTLPTDAVRSQGIACVTADDQRWLRCDIKSTSLLGNVLATQYATEHSATETIQFRDGFLTEGASSNVWIVKNGTLLAPPKNQLILEGIRYALIEELCREEHTPIPFEARPITREEVFAADELFISSASREILPVTTLDHLRIGNGQPGPLYQRLYAAYKLRTEGKHVSP